MINKKKGIVCFLIVLILIILSSYVFAVTKEEACKSVDNCNTYCCAQYGPGTGSECYERGIGGNFYGNIIANSAYSNYNEVGPIECGNPGWFNDNCICFSCNNGGQGGYPFYSDYGPLCCGVEQFLSDYSSCCPGYESVTATERTKYDYPSTYYVYEKVCCPAGESYVGAWPNGKCMIPKKANGEACSSSTECQSGSCIQGTCCGLTNWWLATWNILTPGGAGENTNDNACCPSTDGVLNHICYNAPAVRTIYSGLSFPNGKNNNAAMLLQGGGSHGGVWYNCDTGWNDCRACSGYNYWASQGGTLSAVSGYLNCAGGTYLCWVNSGESSGHGEYAAKGEGCCGDDPNEYYLNHYTSACCDSPNDCVDESGDCKAPGELNDARTHKCIPGWLIICTPTTEICNNKDDDCDGSVDEGLTTSQSCTVGIGACARTGTQSGTCTAGTWQYGACSVIAGLPGTETCNNIDDNCNGAIDDGLTQTQSCIIGTGACARTGTQTKTCSAGTWSAWGICSATPGAPTTENCNDGIDNDCDGHTDGEDASCIYVNSITVPSTATQNTAFTVTCGISSTTKLANCIGVKVDGVAIPDSNFIGWSGTSPQFTYTSSTTGQKTLECYISNKADGSCNIGSDTGNPAYSSKTATITISPSSCSGLSQTECIGNCKWCSSCSSSQSFTGTSQCIASTSTCSYSCKKNSCNALCDANDGTNCDLSTCSCKTSGACDASTKICSGYWCSSGQVCGNNKYWNGIECTQASGCGTNCPYTPPQPQYWTTPACFSGSYSCCQVNYGTPTTDWVKIDVINPQS